MGGIGGSEGGHEEYHAEAYLVEGATCDEGSSELAVTFQRTTAESRSWVVVCKQWRIAFMGCS